MGNGRNFGLDALRAIAIIGVIWGHGAIFMPGYSIRGFINAPAMLGVELFYALSGYFIGNILLEIQESGGGARNIGLFLVRRWMRTLPLYYFMLAVLIVFPPLDMFVRFNTLNYLTLTQYLAVPTQTAWYGVSWSLVIEEWSYILLPALAFGIFRWSKNPVLMAAIFMCIAGWLMRIFFTDQHSVWDEGVRKTAIFRADALSYGVMLAYLIKLYGHQAVKNWSLKLLPLALLVLAGSWLMYADNYQGLFGVWISMHGIYGRIFFLSITCIAMCVLLPIAADYPAVGPGSKIVRYIAKISYALYLAHWPWMFILGGVPKSLQFVVFIVGSLASASLLSFLIEQPIMKMRPRISRGLQPHG